MDFVKREDQNVVNEENYKAYLENIQKFQQIETEYQHTPISIEQLHQAMQSSLNSNYNFQLPLSPRQMSTLMLKTNQIRNFNEIPAHIPRNLSSEIDLVQNLVHELPQTLRHEDMILNRNLDVSLTRSLNNDLDGNTLNFQSISDQDLSRINVDLNRIVDVIPNNIRHDLPHVTHELDLSHHLNRNLDHEILNQERRLQDNGIMDNNLAASLNQRLISTNLIHEARAMIQNEQLLPMQFHIKAEAEDEGYYYDNRTHDIGNVNEINEQIPLPQPVQTLPSNLHQEPMYVYNNSNVNLPALNPIDLYTRQQYVSQYVQEKDNPQNLVMHRYENHSPYEEYKKYHEETDTPKIEPKENLNPNDNKIYNNELGQNYDAKGDSDDNRLTISEDTSLIKGEYVCYKCNEVFSTKRGLKQHAKSCTDSEELTEKLGKFACTQCSYRCQSAAILKIHERTHSGEKPFSCSFCDYKSGQKNNVAKHILVHKKEKPFRCQFCDYRCAQKNNLVVHERTHTGIKPFACPYCDYRTVQKPNLVKHMYLHTDQKPFSCDICSYRCVQKTNLTKHKQRHLNEKNDKVEVKTQKPYKPRQKTFKCPHCQYRSVQKNSLVKHMSFKHPEIPLETSYHDQELEIPEQDSVEQDVVSNVEHYEENCEESIDLCVKKDVSKYQENDLVVTQS